MPIETFKAVSTKLPTGLSVKAAVRGFEVVMDEPQSLSGSNKGMNPVEAVLSAMGACQCIVASAFAAALRFDLQDFHVELEGDLDPDGFLRGKPGVRNGFTQIRVAQHIKTSASAEQVAEFLRFVAARCPVFDTLTHGVEVVAKPFVIEH
jgi:uncharacterized OsmC-like protein